MSFIEQAFSDGRIMSLLGILSISDEEAYSHALSVANTVEEYLNIAKQLGELEWSEEVCLEIIKGALLHDIGKGFLPFGLQHSFGELTDYEMEIIKSHPLLGIVSIKGCNFSQIVQDIVLMHHANADGSGYPMISKTTFDKSNVPDYVWLVAYADRFEAMVNKRNFRTFMSYPKAWKEVLSMSKNEILPYKFTRIFGEIIKNRSILPIETKTGRKSEM